MNKDWKKYNGALITNLPPHEKNDMGKMKMLVKDLLKWEKFLKWFSK